MAGFVHLHGHSTYSLLDGACRLDRLTSLAAEQGAPALAVTDHGNLFGAVEFYKSAQRNGVKPILGFEAYVAPRSRRDRERNPVAAWHLTLLAQNLTGWRNLIKLSSAGYTEGFYYVPRIDRELLEAHGEGLIVLSGCLSGEQSYWIRNGDVERARETASFYKDVFGDRFYLEIQRHGIGDEEKCLEQCVAFSREMGVPLVATNDYHYEHRDDAEAQEVLVCINTGKKLQDQDRMKMESSELFFKSPEEMLHLFRDLPESCRSTLEIAERCNVELSFGELHLPHFDIPTGESPDQYLRSLCEKGLAERYPDTEAETRERLDKELGVIGKTGFETYFLIVADFIHHAREIGVPVGPGRGSAAGSLVAYCLGITDVDPLKYDLLFERFLNAERISMPDIDIDFCRDGRDRVIRYVVEKYGGPERVAQIITFGRMAARAVIRDVGRALDVPLPKVDRIAKKVPNGPGATLQGALESDAELRTMAEEGDDETRKLFHFALKLEGCHRNAGTHAAGVVVADAPLTEYVPLYRNGDDLSTQFSMDILEELGLLKIDFLGLKTLTVIDKTLALIRDGGGQVPDFETPDFQTLADAPTYALLQRGESFGVFQLESGGMRELMARLQPSTFEEVIVLIALYRPGPLDAGMHETYCNRKNGTEPVVYDHPSLEPLLRNTYGVIVYQEQVMRIANVLAGFSLNQADSLRKAMGKKKPEVMEPFKEPFFSGCGQNGIDRECAEQIWNKMALFARYGFNKSHATAYALITYQTAYLKAHFPREFMAALMSCDAANIDKVTDAIEECRRMEIDVRMADVNRSSVDFRVEEEGIRFGLASVRGVGTSAAAALVGGRDGGREYRTLFDLAERTDVRLVNKSGLEALIKAGACDGLEGHRAQQVEALDTVLRAAGADQKDARAGQLNLLAALAPPEAEIPSALPEVPAWSESEVLSYEREATGRYWTSHPLAAHEALVRTFASHTTRSVQECNERDRVVLGGLLVSLQERIIRSGRNEGRKMARFRIEDFHGSVEAVMFSDAYDRLKGLMEENRILFFCGDADASREEITVRVAAVAPPEQAPSVLAGRVQVLLQEAPDADLGTLRELVGQHPGDRPLYFTTQSEGCSVLIRADDAYRVDPSPEFIQGARTLLGERAVRLLPPKGKRPEDRVFGGAPPGGAARFRRR